MRHFFALLMAMFLFSTGASAASIGPDCTLNGKKLYGSVKVVDSFADFTVKRVDSFPGQ